MILVSLEICSMARSINSSFYYLGFAKISFFTQFAHAALDPSAFLVRNSCPDAFFVEPHAERLLWWNLLAGRDPRVPAPISTGEKT